MKLTDLIDKLNFIKDNCSWGTHPTIENQLSIYIDNDENDEIIDVEIIDIEPNRNWGCNCWLGATITLKIINNDNIKQ